ncbi:hypothetical protein ACBJ59_36305 [Nonomuraea sp. MTCD27]
MMFPHTEGPDGGCFLVWFVFCLVLALGMAGVGVWAVITLVNHFTA